jgi:hypothetical protein
MVVDVEKFKTWLRRYACHVVRSGAGVFSAGFLRLALDFARISGVDYTTPEFQRFLRELWEAVQRLEAEGYLALTNATCAPRYLEKVEGLAGVDCGLPPSGPYSAVVVIPAAALRCEEAQEAAVGGRKAARRAGRTKLTEYM